MHRDMRQMGWADEAVAEKGRNSRLDRIGAVLDWAALARLVSVIYDTPKGRPSYPPALMVRSLLLAQWYGLSDPELEEALSDRLSFRRFVGLSLEDGTPDHSTVSRFRGQLRRHGLDAGLFAEVNRQLEARGLILKRGTLLDATLVQAQVATPRNESSQGASRSTVDSDANWTRQYGRSHFGYKAHLAVDQDSGLIRRAVLTPAKTAESEVADDLICGDERAVYADKSYEHKDRRRRLKARGIKDRIMHRRHKYISALPRWQQRRNVLIGPIRRKVERVFGTLKRGYGYTRVRYTSLRANAAQLYLLLTAFNLRRALVLVS